MKTIYRLCHSPVNRFVGWFFVIFHNSRKLFLAKTFLEFFFKMLPCFMGNHNLLFSFHTVITILPNGGIEAMDTTEGLQKIFSTPPCVSSIKKG